MKNKIIILGASSLMAMAVLASPLSAVAADPGTNAPATGESAPKHKKHESLQYHGKVTAIDNKGSTLTVGTLVLEVSSKTHIVKDGQPATLDQGMVGEQVSGSYRKSSDGKLHAVSIHFGGRPGKPRKEMDGGSTTTNGVTK